MPLQRMDHVGIVVHDLAEAIEFFTQIGFELEGETSVGGALVDRLIGLEGVQADVAMLRAPQGGRLELSTFRSPEYDGKAPAAPSNAPGIRHISCAVDDVDAVLARLQASGTELVGEVEQYESSYRLCYVRGPAGVIVELAERLA